MPRPEKPFHVNTGQAVLNTISEDQFSSASELYKYAASEYNNKKPAEFPSVDFQLFRLRIEKGSIKLNFAAPKGKRGKDSGFNLTDEHKKKMMEGRTKKKSDVNPTDDEEKWRSNMKKEFASQPNLLAGVLKKNRKAIAKANCIMCVGGCIDNVGYQTAIKECRGLMCVRWIERPYK